MADFTKAVFSDHAILEINRRNIEKEVVIEVLVSFDTMRTVRNGRVVLHKTLIAKNHTKALLYRVFVDVDCHPPVIVTVYATSKISKYEALQ